MGWYPVLDASLFCFLEVDIMDYWVEREFVGCVFVVFYNEFYRSGGP